MSADTASSRNWFDQGGQDYARFRPEYPHELAAVLASVAPGRRLAVDVGCGNGQLTQLLVPWFDEVVGLDPSAEQIANAVGREGLGYRCAPAERLPLPDASADLITAAQAAHWFELPAFYREARRIAAPGAILALISYGVLTLEPVLDERFQAFYRDEIGPYWPPERKLVDSGYATIDFPFEELAAPTLEIRVEWDLPACLPGLPENLVRRTRGKGGGQGSADAGVRERCGGRLGRSPARAAGFLANRHAYRKTMRSRPAFAAYRGG